MSNSTVDNEYTDISPEIEQSLTKAIEKLHIIKDDLNQKSSQELQKSIEFRKQNNVSMTKKCLKTKMVIDLSKKTIENLISELEDQQKTVKQTQLISYLPNSIPLDDQEDDDTVELQNELDTLELQLQNALKILLKAIKILQNSYDNNDQISEQELQKSDEYLMQKNSELSKKCLNRKDEIDSHNENIMKILSKLQKHQFVIKDFQMSLNSLLNLVASQSDENSNESNSNENQLTTIQEIQHETFADPFKVHNLFLAKIDEKLTKLIENPKFAPESNNEDKMSAILSDLQTDDMSNVNPFGSSFFDADENEADEYDDFDGFVKF